MVEHLDKEGLLKRIDSNRTIEEVYEVFEQALITRPVLCISTWQMSAWLAVHWS